MSTDSSITSPVARERALSGAGRPALAAARSGFLRWVLVLGVVAAVGLPREASAQRKRGGGDIPKDLVEDESLYKCGKAKGKVAVNFKPEVELQDLITWAMGFTCKNFVFSSGVGGRSAKVTVMAPKKMWPKQAWRLFLVSLQSMNLTVVPKGNVLEIVEAPQAKNQPLPLSTRGRASNSDQLVRVVMRPKHLSAENLAAVLSELKSKSGEVKPVGNANIVVITDFGSHITKMTQLANEVDQPAGGESLYMVRVRYADATELATKLTEILGKSEKPAAKKGKRRRRRRKKGKNDKSPDQSTEAIESAVPSKIVAEERTNSLVLLASEPAYLRVKALVERLDVKIDVQGGGRINVYYLKHADAEEMANTLTSVISGIQQGGNDDNNNRRRRRRRRQQNDDENSAPAFEGEVRVTHDKATNSLVIVASIKDFLAVRDVIRRLDVARPQVYIEASIVEVSADNTTNLGTSFHGGETVGDGAIVLGGAQHQDLSSINPATLLGATGLLGGALGAPLEGAEEILLGQSIPSFGVLFQALANNNKVNLLSSPHILTMDNEEAEILVGENIPYVSGSFSTPFGGQQGGQGQAAGLFPGTNIQRQDVALTLKLTPQISAAERVRLNIDLEISNIASRDFEGLGPSWAKRTIKDTVIVPDQQTVVIGGLMRDRVTSNESKIPLLGDIPILGYLFKFKTKSKQKTNLLVMLTPYIVQSHLDIENIVQRRVREQREFMRTFSTFNDIDYRPEVNYARKRGLLAEINKSIDRVHEEEERLRQFDTGGINFESGPIEYDDVEEAREEDELEEEGEPAADDDAEAGASEGDDAEAGASEGGDDGEPAEEG